MGNVAKGLFAALWVTILVAFTPLDAMGFTVVAGTRFGQHSVIVNRTDIPQDPAYEQTDDARFGEKATFSPFVSLLFEPRLILSHLAFSMSADYYQYEHDTQVIDEEDVNVGTYVKGETAMFIFGLSYFNGQVDSDFFQIGFGVGPAYYTIEGEVYFPSDNTRVKFSQTDATLTTLGAFFVEGKLGWFYLGAKTSGPNIEINGLEIFPGFTWLYAGIGF